MSMQENMNIKFPPQEKINEYAEHYNPESDFKIPSGEVLADQKKAIDDAFSNINEIPSKLRDNLNAISSDLSADQKAEEVNRILDEDEINTNHDKVREIQRDLAEKVERERRESMDEAMGYPTYTEIELKNISKFNDGIIKPADEKLDSNIDTQINEKEKIIPKRKIKRIRDEFSNYDNVMDKVHPEYKEKFQERYMNLFLNAYGRLPDSQQEYEDFKNEMVEASNEEWDDYLDSYGGEVYTTDVEGLGYEEKDSLTAGAYAMSKLEGVREKMLKSFKDKNLDELKNDIETERDNFNKPLVKILKKYNDVLPKEKLYEMSIFLQNGFDDLIEDKLINEVTDKKEKAQLKKILKNSRLENLAKEIDKAERNNPSKFAKYGGMLAKAGLWVAGATGGVVAAAAIGYMVFPYVAMNWMIADTWKTAKAASGK